MFGWRKKKSSLTQAQLREAYLKRLAEVIGAHENESDPSEASQRPPSTKSLEMNAEPESSRP